jgi:hypothetical protein
MNEYLKGYTDLGWAIFPVKSDRTPYTPHGFKDATKDYNKAVKLFAPYPDALIAVATGAISGIEVLDVDVKKQADGLPKPGLLTMESLNMDHGPLPETVMQGTPSGGRHYFFKRHDNKPMKTRTEFLLGLDIRAEGAYIVIASPHVAHYTDKNGDEINGQYNWLTPPEKTELAFAPDWLIRLTHEQAQPSGIKIPDLQDRIKQQYGKDVTIKDYSSYYALNCYITDHKDLHPSMLISKTTGRVKCLSCSYESSIDKDFGISISQTLDIDRVFQEGRIDIISAIKEKPPDYDFVMPGFKIGSVGAVIATGGTGKGFFELQTGISIAAGVSLCGGIWETSTQPVKTGKVTIFPAEDAKEDIEKRMYSISEVYKSKNITIDPDLLNKNLQIVSLVGCVPELMDKDGQISGSGFYDAIIKYCYGSRLIILDPFSRFRGISEENSNALATRFVQRLESIAQKTGGSILITHHTNKFSSFSGVGDQKDAGRGASAFTDAVRFQINLSTMTESEAKVYLSSPSYDRTKFLKVTMSKVNYAEQQSLVWLHREVGGVLMKTELIQNQKVVEIGSNKSIHRRAV